MLKGTDNQPTVSEMIYLLLTKSTYFIIAILSYACVMGEFE